VNHLFRSDSQPRSSGRSAGCQTSDQSQYTRCYGIQQFNQVLCSPAQHGSARVLSSPARPRSSVLHYHARAKKKSTVLSCAPAARTGPRLALVGRLAPRTARRLAARASSMLRQLSLQHEPRQHSARAAPTDPGPTRTRALLEAPGLHPARPAPVSESAGVVG
jgi:hypothetical protein